MENLVPNSFNETSPKSSNSKDIVSLIDYFNQINSTGTFLIYFSVLQQYFHHFLHLPYFYGMKLPMTEKSTCIHCHLPRAKNLHCGLCEEAICADCVINNDPDRTKYWRVDRPEELSHLNFCPRCYDERIVPLYEQYDALLAAADDTHYFPKAYRGLVPVLKKGRLEISVQNSPDRMEALTQLQFDAVQQGFNGLLQVDLVGEKTRDSGPRGYQKTLWRATALPVSIDRDKLDRGFY